MEKDFEWLTEEICREFINRAKALPPNNGLDTGPWRDLRKELQERCHIPEIQAYNIIHGYHVREYVNMYDILSGRIPMPEAMKKRQEKDEKKKSMADKLREYEERIEELECLRQQGLARGTDYTFEEKD
ncbi:MAG: hypothetical protein J5864_08875 [Oscillospiraceae bacterium]|nr:hypothetical protein [Oscillospiraceae bacterium]